MGYKSPIRSPGSHDRFRLVEGKDTLFSPGIVVEAKLEPRAVEIQDMQQPGFAGAIAVQRLEKIWTGTYRYKLWSSADYEADKAFVAILRAGMKKGNAPTGILGQGRRARVWRLSDPRLQGLDVVNVLVESVGALDGGGPGRPWTREIKFHEYKKPVQLPLLKVEPTAADSEIDRQTAAQDAQNKALTAQLDAMIKSGPTGLSAFLAGLGG